MDIVLYILAGYGLVYLILCGMITYKTKTFSSIPFIIMLFWPILFVAYLVERFKNRV